MRKNRSNRPQKDLPSLQGFKDYETNTTHKPLNNHQPRMGIAKHKRRKKCRCVENCSGCKNKTIAEQEKHWTKWNFD